MAINSDFRDLFSGLNDSGARYLLVGAHAVALYAEPRLTKDLDIWIDTEPGNALRVLQTLRDFGAPLVGLTAADLQQPDLVFQIGVAPNRIDIMTSIDGVAFAEAWDAREESRYADQTIPVISREHLIKNKRASGRPQDLLDVERLARG